MTKKLNPQQAATTGRRVVPSFMNQSGWNHLREDPQDIVQHICNKKRIRNPTLDWKILNHIENMSGRDHL